VHVWRARLDLSPARLGELERVLSADERERAARFRRDVHRWRYTAGRGILRVLLARYLTVSPQEPRFAYGPHGRPELAEPLAGSGIRFNVSHSEDLALYAFAVGRDVGIDVEAIREDMETLPLAKRFFAPGEAAILASLPESIRAEAFFTCWTRKEAFIKARGDGLSLPLDEFEVTLSPGEPAMLRTTRWDPADAARWSMIELYPAPGFKAALVAAGPLGEIRCFEWQPGQRTVRAG